MAHEDKSAISKVMASANEAGMLTVSAREASQAANLAGTSQVLNAASTMTDGASGFDLWISEPRDGE